MTEDTEPVTVRYKCCDYRNVIKFGDLKRSPRDHGFICPNPNCRSAVTYDGVEFVKLMNEAPGAKHQISLRPINN